MHRVVASVLLITGLPYTGTALWHGQLIAAVAIALTTLVAVAAWYPGFGDTLTNPFFSIGRCSRPAPHVLFAQYDATPRWQKAAPGDFSTMQ